MIQGEQEFPERLEDKLKDVILSRRRCFYVEEELRAFILEQLSNEEKTVKDLINSILEDILGYGCVFFKLIKTYEFIWILKDRLSTH